ncbi:NAD-dependent succinate-semialdehyde dehydrogenase [Parasphingorhabdus sp.]|uniref:NAD-dependent succinate-semialdehyde dehydrogenase n=1 Tax=Parasphingorhabdus sp. TaxID=2709688 RepID=UPI003A92DCED
MISSAYLKHDAYIDGNWSAAASGESFAVYNPADGTKIASVADCGTADTERAIAAADRAFASWSTLTAAARAAKLMSWHELMLAHEQDLAKILTAEMGKPLAEAVGEIRYGASYLEWYAEEAKRIYGDVIPHASGDVRTIVVKQPIGVCAAITPWNFPNAMLMRKVAAALAAGCTMVAKPAEDTPLSALAIAALAEQAGIPPGVLNILPTSKAAEVGQALTSSPIVRKLSFTGSTEVGRLLLEQCAPTIKKTSLELGGNAPFIIFDDADIDAAMEGLIASKFRNAGQTCVCANRIFVHRSVHPEVTQKLIDRVQRMKVGPGDTAENDIGPLINVAAVEKVEKLVAGAMRAGAQVLIGGDRDEAGDLFFQPTVLDNISNDMEIARSEIFGPVATLIPFDSEAEVIALANDTPYGLAAYFYSRDIGRVWRVGEALEYGMVGINQGIISSAAAPFGGVKQSGLGREGSKYGLEDYLEIKYLCLGGIAE